MSSSAVAWTAAWRAHGAGTISEAQVADALAERPVHADVGGVARAEIVAGDDHEAVVGAVAEPFGEGQL